MKMDLKKVRYKLTIPHLESAKRKALGCPEGELVCQVCGAKNASRNRQRTAYVNSDNTATLCPKCQNETDEYWTDQWNDYYSGLM